MAPKRNNNSNRRNKNFNNSNVNNSSNPPARSMSTSSASSSATGTSASMTSSSSMSMSASQSQSQSSSTVSMSSSSSASKIAAGTAAAELETAVVESSTNGAAGMALAVEEHQSSPESTQYHHGSSASATSQEQQQLTAESMALKVEVTPAATEQFVLVTSQEQQEQQQSGASSISYQESSSSSSSVAVVEGSSSSAESAASSIALVTSQAEQVDECAVTSQVQQQIEECTVTSQAQQHEECSGTSQVQQEECSVTSQVQQEECSVTSQVQQQQEECVITSSQAEESCSTAVIATGSSSSSGSMVAVDNTQSSVQVSSSLSTEQQSQSSAVHEASMTASSSMSMSATNGSAVTSQVQGSNGASSIATSHSNAHQSSSSSSSSHSASHQSSSSFSSTSQSAAALDLSSTLAGLSTSAQPVTTSQETIVHDNGEEHTVITQTFKVVRVLVKRADGSSYYKNQMVAVDDKGNETVVDANSMFGGNATTDAAAGGSLVSPVVPDSALGSMILGDGGSPTLGTGGRVQSATTSTSTSAKTETSASAEMAAGYVAETVQHFEAKIEAHSTGGSSSGVLVGGSTSSSVASDECTAALAADVAMLGAAHAVEADKQESALAALGHHVHGLSGMAHAHAIMHTQESGEQVELGGKFGSKLDEINAAAATSSLVTAATHQQEQHMQTQSQSSMSSSATTTATTALESAVMAQYPSGTEETLATVQYTAGTDETLATMQYTTGESQLGDMVDVKPTICVMPGKATTITGHETQATSMYATGTSNLGESVHAIDETHATAMYATGMSSLGESVEQQTLLTAAAAEAVTEAQATSLYASGTSSLGESVNLTSSSSMSTLGENKIGAATLEITTDKLSVMALQGETAATAMYASGTEIEATSMSTSSSSSSSSMTKADMVVLSKSMLAEMAHKSEASIMNLYPAGTEAEAPFAMVLPAIVPVEQHETETVQVVLNGHGSEGQAPLAMPLPSYHQIKPDQTVQVVFNGQDSTTQQQQQQTTKQKQGLSMNGPGLYLIENPDGTTTQYEGGLPTMEEHQQMWHMQQQKQQSYSEQHQTTVQQQQQHQEPAARGVESNKVVQVVYDTTALKISRFAFLVQTSILSILALLSRDAVGASCENHSYTVLAGLVSFNGVVWAALTWFFGQGPSAASIVDVSGSVSATHIAGEFDASIGQHPHQPHQQQPMDWVQLGHGTVHTSLRLFKTVMSPRAARYILYMAALVQVLSLMYIALVSPTFMLAWALMIASSAMVLHAAIRLGMPAERVPLSTTYEIYGQKYEDVSEFDLDGSFNVAYESVAGTTSAVVNTTRESVMQASGQVNVAVTGTVGSVRAWILGTWLVVKLRVLNFMLAVTATWAATVLQVKLAATWIKVSTVTLCVAAWPLVLAALRLAAYAGSLVVLYYALGYAYSQLLTPELRESMIMPVTKLANRVTEYKTIRTETQTTVIEHMSTTLSHSLHSAYEAVSVNLVGSSAMWLILALNVLLWLFLTPIFTGSASASVNSTTKPSPVQVPTPTPAPAPQQPTRPSPVAQAERPVSGGFIIKQWIPNLAMLLIPVMLIAGFAYPSVTGSCNMWMQSAINLGLVVIMAKMYTSSSTSSSSSSSSVSSGSASVGMVSGGSVTNGAYNSQQQQQQQHVQHQQSSSSSSSSAASSSHMMANGASSSAVNTCVGPATVTYRGVAKDEHQQQHLPCPTEDMMPQPQPVAAA